MCICAGIFNACLRFLLQPQEKESKKTCFTNFFTLCWETNLLFKYSSEPLNSVFIYLHPLPLLAFVDNFKGLIFLVVFFRSDTFHSLFIDFLCVSIEPLDLFLETCIVLAASFMYYKCTELMRFQTISKVNCWQA